MICPNAFWPFGLQCPEVSLMQRHLPRAQCSFGPFLVPRVELGAGRVEELEVLEGGVW